MTRHTDYTAYFQQIATDILNHSPEEKHFFRKGLEEFLNGLQGKVNYPALLLDKYDYDYNDNGADSVLKKRTVAFIVCDHAKDQEDYDRIDAILDETEALVDRIYNRMRKDIRNQHGFLKYARLDDVKVSPIENYADGNHGWFVTIDIYTHHNTSLT